MFARGSMLIKRFHEPFLMIHLKSFIVAGFMKAIIIMIPIQIMRKYWDKCIDVIESLWKNIIKSYLSKLETYKFKIRYVESVIVLKLLRYFHTYLYFFYPRFI